MSVPMPSGAHLKPIEAPSPPDEPPGVRDLLCGLSVAPVMLLLQQRCWTVSVSAILELQFVLTMSDWGWFVRTWKTAPALASNCSRRASSVVTLSTLESIRDRLRQEVADLPSYVSCVTCLVLEPDMLLHADRNAMLNKLDYLLHIWEE